MAAVPKAGAFEFPSRDLDDCVSYLRKARDALRAPSMTRDSFARAIAQSASGGGFGKLVGAMVSYGLVETGRGRITTTDLAEQIMFGNPEMQRRGREESVRGVRLFDEIYRKLGVHPTEEQLRVFLREDAGTEAATAKNLAAEMGRLLTKNAVNISAVGFSGSDGDLASQRSLGGLIGRLETADYGVLNIRDQISMDLAISLLNRVKDSRDWTGPESGHRRNRGRQRKSPAKARGRPRTRKR